MALEIIVKSSELNASRNVYRQKLDNPLIKFQEKMKSKGSNGSGMMSLESSIAVDAIETFFGAYGVVKQKVEQLPESSVAEYQKALNFYALFVAASYAHTRIGKNVENERTCHLIPSVKNIDDEYLLVNELAEAYLKTITPTKTAKQLAEATKGYFSAIKTAAKRELTAQKYRAMMKELDKNVQISFEEDSQEFSALKQKKTKKGKKKQDKIEIVTFDMIGGNYEAKKILNGIIESINHPDKERYGYESPTGIFMYGLPGTGKTMLAKALAHECGMPFNYINLTEVLSKWHGESEQNLREAMMQEGVVFLDEYDSIGKKLNDHDGTSVKLVNVMAEAMEGFDSNGSALYIAASNDYNVDPKLLRRFQEHVYFGPQNQGELKEILLVQLKRKQGLAKEPIFNGLDAGRVSEALYKKSMQDMKDGVKYAIVGSDVRNIVRKVHDIKWEQHRKTGTFEKISTADFYPVIQAYTKRDQQSK